MAQQIMYPGQVNSPVTELAAAISDSDTTIPLLDASALPAGPNLATIGRGENAETILYTDKDGNDLTGVTRGFDGTTAAAWSLGAKVARLFTRYDYDALRTNVLNMDSEKINVIEPIDLDDPPSAYPMGMSTFQVESPVMPLLTMVAETTVVKDSGNAIFAVQRLTGRNGLNKLFTNLRYAVYGVWGEWELIAMQAEVTAVADALTTHESETVHIGNNLSAELGNGSGQSVPDDTSHPLVFTQVRYDNATMFSAANPTRLTAKETGKYLVFGYITYVGNATGWRSASILLNGSALVGANRTMNVGAVGATYVNVAKVVSLSVDQYVELVARQNSGGALTVTGGNDISFGMVRVG